MSRRMPTQSDKLQNSAMNLTKVKADILTKRLNKVTTALAKQCEDADLLEVEAQDVTQYAAAKLPTLPSLPENINVQMMLDDFSYVRNVLRENTECARAMLEHVSGNMLDEDDNITPGMITAFSELNKSITENMKLYVSSYKDLSAALSNLQPKLHNNVGTTNNTVIINSSEDITVKDIVERLRHQNDPNTTKTV